MIIRHVADNLYQCFVCVEQCLKRHGLISHSGKSAFIFAGDIFQGWADHFMHRAVVAQAIDDEGTAKIIRDAFIGQQVAHVEEIAWMLPVEGGNYLAAIEIGKRDKLHLGKPEIIFDSGRDSSRLRFEDAAH